eukprot:TRINITY_DN4023_c0_g1_i1.p1 TRINITY_DN4023_c0_g1~~TRINITY_DN4023_c0_g1_i1.p1  ORF type:complete len:109 (-),score=13.74 TRINITY_DN4023_c0_g1_i1:6-332(-)
MVSSFPFQSRKSHQRVMLFGRRVACVNLHLKLLDLSVWNQFVPNWSKISYEDQHGRVWIVDLHKLVLRFNLVTGALFVSCEYESWLSAAAGTLVSVTEDCFILYSGSK